LNLIFKEAVVATYEQNLRTLHQIENRMMNPPEDEECEEHHWQYQGQAEDGTPFYKCTTCGVEEEG
jgi:DNA-directed RNA polymerase subunit M/transcription elongation factor TFIIS